MNIFWNNSVKMNQFQSDFFGRQNPEKSWHNRLWLCPSYLKKCHCNILYNDFSFTDCNRNIITRSSAIAEIAGVTMRPVIPVDRLTLRVTRSISMPHKYSMPHKSCIIFELYDTEEYETSNSRLGVTQGHWRCHHSIDRTWAAIRF